MRPILEHLSSFLDQFGNSYLISEVLSISQRLEAISSLQHTLLFSSLSHHLHLKVPASEEYQVRRTWYVESLPASLTDGQLCQDMRMR